MLMCERATRPANRPGWAVWKQQFERYFRDNYGDAYGPGGVMANTGEECWRAAFDAGWTPQQAIEEDRYYWAD